MADRPDDAGKSEREEQTKKRPGKGDDDFVERGNARERGAIDIHFALDDVHRRELRQGDKAAERNRAERVGDSVDFLFPDRLAEPDTELLDHQPAPFRREEMPELMHDDEQVKEDDDLEEDEEKTECLRYHA